MLERCLALLREREAELHTQGVLHAGIFGSVARGTNRPDSDIEEFEKFFGREVDGTDFGGLKSPKHDCILEDILAAF